MIYPASQDSVPDYAMLQGLIVGMFEVEAGSVPSMKPITASSFKSVWSRNRGYLPVYYVKHVERFTKIAAEEAIAKVVVAYTCTRPFQPKLVAHLLL